MTAMSRFEKFFINRRRADHYGKLIRSMEDAGQLAIGKTSVTLEVGCGNGNLSALIHDRFHPSRLNVTDYDQGQVDVAKRWLGRKYGDVPKSFALRKADVLALDYPDGSIDAVFAFLILHHVGGIDAICKGLDEIQRVLKPGGLFVYVEMFYRDEIKVYLLGKGFEIGWERKFRRFMGRAVAYVARKPGA